MEFSSAFPTDGEALELMEQGEGLLDDVSEFAQAQAHRGTVFISGHFTVASRGAAPITSVASIRRGHSISDNSTCVT
ncbi:hypothetical protein [Streptomyces sp. NPDC048419]|uniref:hypothetical protein n=1 Tax=Streptomyces sp. NPDC048419 TaxID=3365547 RepID=UPI00371C4EE6